MGNLLLNSLYQSPHSASHLIPPPACSVRCVILGLDAVGLYHYQGCTSQLPLIDRIWTTQAMQQPGYKQSFTQVAVSRNPLCRHELDQ